MDYTTNKNLAKPTENETYDLATVNENMDKIDAALKTNDDAITQLTEKSQCGKALIHNGRATVTFDHKFTEIPCVFVQTQGNSENVLLSTKVNSITKTGFEIVVNSYNDGVIGLPSYDFNAYWFAIT